MWMDPEYKVFEVLKRLDIYFPPMHTNPEEDRPRSPHYFWVGMKEADTLPLIEARQDCLTLIRETVEWAEAQIEDDEYAPCIIPGIPDRQLETSWINLFAVTSAEDYFHAMCPWRD